MSGNFDVIVVGAGGSGLAAACSAAEHGGRVLVLEKQPQPGGTTRIAVGSFTAAGTSLQADADIEDDAAAHIEDVRACASPEIESRNSAAFRSFFLREAAATYEWLRKQGLAFVGPLAEPSNRVPRMHNVVLGAQAYIDHLRASLLHARGSLICGAAVKELLTDPHGSRIVGVRATIKGKSIEYHASRGVILAAGDYAGDASTIQAFKGAQFGSIEGINPFARGDGHRLAEAAGARLLNMDVTYGPELRFIPAGRNPLQPRTFAAELLSKLWRPVLARMPDRLTSWFAGRPQATWQHPEDALFGDGAILINRLAQRFVNEHRSPEREIAVAAQPDKEAFILLDARLVARYAAWPHFVSTAPNVGYAYVQDYQRLRPDMTTTGHALTDLALRAGFSAAELRATVDAFNRYTDGSTPDPLGRSGDSSPLARDPWVLLGPVRAFFTTTEGGAAINEQLQVLDRHGAPIPGLYAVGQNGLNGMILWGHGLHIAWAMTSGRLAGRAIMDVGNSESA